MRTRTSLAVCLPAAFVVLVATSVAQQQRPDRSKVPALGPAPQLTLPPIQKRTLSNGLNVWIVEAHEVPLVQVNLLVLAGSGDDPAGKFGLASLTSAMLDEGAAIGAHALERNEYRSRHDATRVVRDGADRRSAVRPRERRVLREFA